MGSQGSIALLLVGVSVLGALQAACLPSILGSVDPGAGRWAGNVGQWLDLSYVEQDETAGFSTLAVSSLQSPNLYATYWASMLMRQLDPSLRYDSNVARWLGEIRQEDGSYSDSAHGLRAHGLMDTLRATELFAMLGESVPDPGLTAKHILSLAAPDGLFSFDFGSEHAPDERVEDRLFASRFAVKALARLGLGPDAAPAKMRETLLAYVAAYQGSVQADLADERFMAFLAALFSLSWLDRSAVGPAASALVDAAFEGIALLPPDPFLAGNVNVLLDVADAVGSTRAFATETYAAVHAYLHEKVLPLQSDRGGYEVSPGATELNLTWQVVALTKRVGVEYPRSRELLHELDRRRLDDGWAGFVILNLNNKSQHTYYALEIAKRVGYTGFDRAKVAAYLEKTLLGEEAELRELYYALKAYRLINRRVDPYVMDNVERLALRAAEGLGADMKQLSDFYHFFLLAREAGFAVPPDIANKGAALAAQLKELIDKDERYQNLLHIHMLYTLERALPESGVSSDEIVALVMGLLDESGGFLGRPGGIPMIEPTFLAFEILGELGVDVDSEGLTSFILAAREDYGFNYMPVEIARARGAAPVADFKPTYMALVMLETLWQRQVLHARLAPALP